MGQRAAADYREDQPFRWNSVHKFESLVFKLLGVYIPVLTLLSFPCSFMVVLKPKKWIEHQVEKTPSGSNKPFDPTKKFSGGVNTSKL